MPQVNHNINGEIWVFNNHGFDTTMISYTEQHITTEFQEQSSSNSFNATFVYAKCDRLFRMELWDGIFSVAQDMQVPG